MNIIHTTTALAPEFGGPVRTIPALCHELAKLGHRVKLVYLDFGDTYQTIQLPSHPNLEYIDITVKFNIGLRPLYIPDYRSIVLEFASGKNDLVIHDNGVWLPYSGELLDIAQKTEAKMITTTRGMLEPWAMGYGRIRKNIAWNLYQKKRLMKNDLLHATSREEKQNLRNLGLTQPIAVIPNGTEIPDLNEIPRSSRSGKKKVLFLSRIHPKKGLINLVQAIDLIKPENWEVHIAGYDEGGHQDIVQEAVNQAGLNDYFKFLGPIDDQDKWKLYRSVDLFILPSYSENFGMVVAEALAAEIPVITTKGTPWRDLVDYNCGWWVEPSVPELVESLQEAFSLNGTELNKMGFNGRKLVERNYNWSSIAEKMSETYSWMLGIQAETPDSIK